MKKIITVLLSIAALHSIAVTADTLDDWQTEETLRCAWYGSGILDKGGLGRDFPPDWLS